jgi:flagellar hook protein FlgE
MFSDEKNQNIYRYKQIIMRIVLFLIFIMAPLTLSGCDPSDDSDENTINLSVIGEGYFIVWALEENEAYFTRSSSFSLNQENLFVNPQGYVLQGWAVDENGDLMGGRENIRLPEQILIETVSWDGFISVKLVDGTIRLAYRIALAKFIYPENLQDEGNGLYSSTEESGIPIIEVPGIIRCNEMATGIIVSDIF